MVNNQFFVLRNFHHYPVAETVAHLVVYKSWGLRNSLVLVEKGKHEQRFAEEGGKEAEEGEVAGVEEGGASGVAGEGSTRGPGGSV